MVLLFVLSALLWLIARTEGFFAGELAGYSTRTWFALAVATPVVHQVLVALVWRAELHGGHVTRLLGRLAFPLYGVLFALLLGTRIASLILLATANRGTLSIEPAVLGGAAILAGGLSLWTFYSMLRYFDPRRTIGADHFDAKWREMPLVRQGAFRYFQNAIYTLGALVLWIPGLLYASLAACAVAAFSHAFLWVHYFCTERPDMRRMYGEQPSG